MSGARPSISKHVFKTRQRHAQGFREKSMTKQTIFIIFIIEKPHKTIQIILFLFPRNHNNNCKRLLYEGVHGDEDIRK